MFFDGVRNVFVVSDGAPAAGAASTPKTTITTSGRTGSAYARRAEPA